AFARERLRDAVRTRDRVRLRRESASDLVPAAEGYLQGRRGADAALEWDRGHFAALEERGDLGDILGVAGEVEIEPRAGDDGAVDASERARDSLRAGRRDRVRLDVEPIEPGNLLRHVLGDRGWTDAEHDVARRNELGDGAHVRESGSALRCRLAAPLARPEHLAARRGPDQRTHLTGEEEADSRHLWI